MKSLTLVSLENCFGGKGKAHCGDGGLYDTIWGFSCGVSLAWPIGTLIAGPTCVGLAIGCAAGR